MPGSTEQDVTELLVNRPGEVWIEQRGRMTRRDAPTIDDRLAAAARRAGCAGQQPGRQPRTAAARGDAAQWRARPVRGADGDAGALGAGDPPALPARPSARSLCIRAVAAVARNRVELARSRIRSAFCARRSPDRKTILISGGTSTGKTTFLNALLREVPVEERVIVVEDTAEVQLHGPTISA